MVDKCYKFAASRNLHFGTDPNPSKSKTKCIVFWKRKINNLKKITLNGHELPWVPDVKHLGCTLESNNGMKTDMIQKRGKFIGKVNSLLQEFHAASPKNLHCMEYDYQTSLQVGQKNPQTSD